MGMKLPPTRGQGQHTHVQTHHFNLHLHSSSKHAVIPLSHQQTQQKILNNKSERNTITL
eukprot:m.216525 g.216525  ORF g.216525 m.216525 type:complete len:59 (-) comp13806_c1_seq1:3279-3455(-)